LKVLVTGSSGLIGRWVVKELLDSGYQVRALDREPLPGDLRSRDVEQVYADVTDPLQMLTHGAGCDAVAHLAAIPNPYKAANSELFRVNVIGTQNVLDAAIAHRMQKAIITSSIASLGFSFPKHHLPPESLPVKIDHPRRPQDPYGLSKLMNEESAASATRSSGITTIVLRAPQTMDLYEARDRWLKRMVSERPDRYHSALWCYIDVRDIARAYKLALETELTGNRVYYVMADDVLAESSVRELLSRHLPELSGDAEKLTGHSFYDLKPIENDLGFRAMILWRDVLAGQTAE
jgi:UDP-glucose 4-epimerase